MTKWEHKCTFFSDDEDAEEQERFETLGLEGWELVAVIRYEDSPQGNACYYKRPLPPEQPTLGHVVSCSTSYAPVDIYAPPAVAVTKETNEG